MNKTTQTYPNAYILFIFIFLFLPIKNSFAQFVIKQNEIPSRVSIHNYTEYIDLKNKNLTLDEVLKLPKNSFKDIPNENYDFGFTTSHIWLRFELKNETNEGFSLYFEGTLYI